MLFRNEKKIWISELMKFLYTSDFSIFCLKNRQIGPPKQTHQSTPERRPDSILAREVVWLAEHEPIAAWLEKRKHFPKMCGVRVAEKQQKQQKTQQTQQKRNMLHLIRSQIFFLTTFILDIFPYLQ